MNIELTLVCLIVINDSIKLFLFFFLAILSITISVVTVLVVPYILIFVNIVRHIIVITCISLTSIMIIITLLFHLLLLSFCFGFILGFLSDATQFVIIIILNTLLLCRILLLLLVLPSLLTASAIFQSTISSLHLAASMINNSRIIYLEPDIKNLYQTSFEHDRVGHITSIYESHHECPLALFLSHTDPTFSLFISSHHSSLLYRSYRLT